jgi:hypothetical protein
MRAREKDERLTLFPTLIQEPTKVTRALQRWNNKVTQRKWTALTGRGRRPVLMNHSRAHSKRSPPCFDNWRVISLPNFCSETSTHTHQAKVYMSTAMHIENEEWESCEWFHKQDKVFCGIQTTLMGLNRVTWSNWKEWVRLQWSRTLPVDSVEIARSKNTTRSVSGCHTNHPWQMVRITLCFT